MGVNCDIRFTNSTHGTFLSGQPLTGSVQLKLTETKKFNEILLKIIGISNVQWTTKRGHGRNRRSVAYHAKRDHLASVKVLVAQQNGSPTELPAGEHMYEFALDLPSNLPTSFEGSRGHCRYTAQVIMDRPWKFNLTYKVGFTVVHPVDLNMASPAIRMPACMEDARVFCCGWWRTKPLFVRVTVPYTGFVPGQAIPLRIELNNQTTRVVEGVNMKLLQEVTYTAEHPSTKQRKERHTLVKHIGDGVEGETQRVYEQRLVVPTVPPSCSSNNLISVAYHLHLTVRVAGCGSDPVIDIPIIIGTTPLMMQQQPATVAHPPPSAPSTSMLGFDYGTISAQLPTAPGASGKQSVQEDTTLPPPEYLPPPTYEEATNAAAVVITDDTDTNAIGTKPFVPLYPSYNFSNVQWPPLPSMNPVQAFPPSTSSFPPKQ